MAAVSCWALLLLTVLPLQAIVGQHLPAGSPASSIQTQTAPLVQVPAAPRRLGRRAGAIVGVLGNGHPFQDQSPPPDRKMIPLPNEFQNAVKKTEMEDDDDASIYGHRMLVGSWTPPSCDGKCGTCVPCIPTHLSSGNDPTPGSGLPWASGFKSSVVRCMCHSEFFLP